MPAQYEPSKEASNLKAHGVSFTDAEGVLWDPDLGPAADSKGTQIL